MGTVRLGIKITEPDGTEYWLEIPHQDRFETESLALAEVMLEEFNTRKNQGMTHATARIESLD
jgi:hypothetical protein